MIKKIFVSLAAFAAIFGLTMAPAVAGSDILRGSDLGNLYILNELFDDSVFGGGNDLGELLVLNELFGGGGLDGGLFGGGLLNGGSNLGNLFILNELFDDSIF